MKHYVLDFMPPVVGTENLFNTMRIGMTWSKKLAIGDKVYLQDSKTKMIFGIAVVESVVVGGLGELCMCYGHQNHTEVNSDDPCGSGERLFKLTQKIYGPHIAKVNKKSTVINLRRTNDEGTTWLT